MLTLPAGTYVISDPCYVLSDADYDRALDETDYFGMNCQGGGSTFLDSVHNKKWACFGTAYGDGVYYDNYGHQYGVDAGCIACIPIEMVDPNVILSGARDSHIFEFKSEFGVMCDSGRIFFGHIQINTGDLEDDFYDDDESDWNTEEEEQD